MDYETFHLIIMHTVCKTLEINKQEKIEESVEDISELVKDLELDGLDIILDGIKNGKL